MGQIQGSINQLVSSAMGTIALGKYFKQPGELSRQESKKYVQSVDAAQESGYTELADIKNRLEEHESGKRPLSKTELEDAQNRAALINKKIVDAEQTKRFNPDFQRALKKSGRSFASAHESREAYKRGLSGMPTDRFNTDVNSSFMNMNPTSRTAMMESIGSIQERLAQKEELEKLRQTILNPGEV